MSASKGRTLKLFLVDGAPNGLLTAEIMNWTGHLITGPRSRLGELIQRPEAKRTGVYFLVGAESEAGLGTQIYIGETDDVAQRLTAHNRPEDKGGKDFWEQVCVVTSKDANLTKGHVKYLESRLIQIAAQAKRCTLVNSTDPGYCNLPEADCSDMEYFLDQIQTLLPVLGMEFLREQPRSAQRTGSPATAALPAVEQALRANEESPVFVCEIKRHGFFARAQELDGEFVVLEGSTTRPEWEGTEVGGYKALFYELVQQGLLAPSPDGKLRYFTRSQPFRSPSAAAAVVTGRSANGRIEWVTEDGRLTYGAWAEQRVNQAAERLLAQLDNSPSGNTR
ncbi:GIY-YIG nuclease family protein [Paucibacter sp. DJ1R-11]|uniref:GIY-YIG nuclease family protein n=1 Tax=Paucibacter sp. DJ1R-11 TaxID=2893556 RepID=UPI0021E37556|nr:GIY-YIG nuclease family protein [Paucibacter sp. DJ1R-11]MCV2362487.1 GIY-YIG nuclease family protein [Paucibacter sp. DJ1R-11]